MTDSNIGLFVSFEISEDVDEFIVRLFDFRSGLRSDVRETFRVVSWDSVARSSLRTMATMARTIARSRLSYSPSSERLSKSSGLLNLSIRHAKVLRCKGAVKLRRHRCVAR